MFKELSAKIDAIIIKPVIDPMIEVRRLCGEHRAQLEEDYIEQFRLRRIKVLSAMDTTIESINNTIGRM